MGFDVSNYEPVEERIARFWAKHESGRIVTRLLSKEGDSYVVLASVWRDENADALLPSATGLAQETVGSSAVNRTSALENCETSAVGRALANLGFAPKGQRPSREEMTKASGTGASQGGRPSRSSSSGSRSSNASVPTPAGPSSEGEGKGQPGPAAADGEAAAAPPSSDCIHPVDSRREQASGRIRCLLCRQLID